jgi:hypothetical protein
MRRRLGRNQLLQNIPGEKDTRRHLGAHKIGELSLQAGAVALPMPTQGLATNREEWIRLGYQEEATH